MNTFLVFQSTDIVEAFTVTVQYLTTEINKSCLVSKQKMSGGAETVSVF